MIPDFETFHSWIEQSFHVNGISTSFILKTCTQGSQSSKINSFSVEFFCESPEPMEQQTVTLTKGEHSFDLFLVPVEAVSSGFLYQAVINQEPS